MKHFALSKLLMAGLAAVLSNGALPAAGQETIAFTGATIETLGPQGRLEDGIVLVHDGKIVDVGRDITIPENARRVSLQGKTVMPSLIDPYYVYRREQRPEPPPEFQFRGRGFRGRGGGQEFTVGTFTRIADYFYPYESDFRPAIRSGITTANLVIDGQGQSAFAYLQDEPSEQMIFQPDGLVFTKVTNQTSALDAIRNGLDPQRASRRGSSVRGRFGGRRGSARGTGGEGGEGSGNNQEQPPQDDDQTKALWNDIREGVRPLMVNANNSAAVAHLLKALESYDKVRLQLIATGDNVYPLLNELVNPNYTLVLQPSIERVPYTDQRMNVPKMAYELQIPFALSLSINPAQMNSSQDDPLFALSQLVKTGLPRDVAMEALTVQPAKMLGILQTHGTLEPGKMANLLVFDGDPLGANTRLEQVILQGRTVHEN